MKLWLFIFTILPLTGIAYVLRRTWQILPIATPLKVAVVIMMAILFLGFVFNFVLLDKMPMPLATATYNVGNSGLFILLYIQ